MDVGVDVGVTVGVALAVAVGVAVAVAVGLAVAVDVGVGVAVAVAVGVAVAVAVAVGVAVAPWTKRFTLTTCGLLTAPGASIVTCPMYSPAARPVASAVMSRLYGVEPLADAKWTQV